MKQFTTKISILLGTCLFAFFTTGQTNTFNYSGATQTYVVPAGVAKIQITAVGAAGGTGINASSGNGGSGASMQGVFDVTPGQVLSVLVGGKGFDGANYVGGGGGGSFVWGTSTSALLIAAGGGGGGGATDDGTTFIDGTNATTTENASNGNGLSDGAGFSGNGGAIPTSLPNGDYASGGAGWNSNGNDGTTYGCATNSTGGETPLSGGAGGIGGGSTNPTGGFGGGGGGNGRCEAVGGGGGGGYSGGGPGGEVISGDYNGGGGGGSFNIGALQVNLTSIGNDNGVVTISAVAFVGINEIDAIQVVLFPNPTNGKVTITASESIKKIEIVNVTGKVVAIYSTTNSIDLSQLKNGVYMAKITTVNNKMSIKRIVKK